MKEKVIVQILEALAVGDSFGKSTEFASRGQIVAAFDEITTLLTPEQSLAHQDMLYGQVTDDTEQNIFLLEDFIKAGEVSAEVTAKSLMRWYDETPHPDKYIGPSSSAALKALKAGGNLYEVGKKGASCGGVMRAPAAFLVSTSLEDVQLCVKAILIPTHHHMLAMEAAMGYAYALWKMTETKDLELITAAAIKGCGSVREHHPSEFDYHSAPSCRHRIQYLLKELDHFDSSQDLLDFLFYVYGTTISSCDVFVAAYAIFLWCKADVFEAIKLGTMVGGDTDTIAALAAVLCCAYGEGHQISEAIVKDVRDVNQFNFEGLAKNILALREHRQMKA